MATNNHIDGIVITRQRLYADLQNFLTHALAEPHLESRLYAFYSLSLTAYCLDLVPRWSNVSFGCHPQSYFSHHAGTEQSDEHHRRIPDFAAIITSISTTGIVYDTLVFWVEVKPLDGHAAGNPDSVKSVKDIADAIAVNSIIQVNEQALFSFRHFEGNIHYAFLMVGAYFTLLEYERPSNLTPYVRPAGSLPTSPQKRARSDIRKNVHDDLGDPASIEPEVLYFNEPIFIDRVAGFSPLYLRALDAVAEASVGLFQDFGRPTVFGGPRAVAQPPGERSIGQDMVHSKLLGEQQRYAETQSPSTQNPPMLSVASTVSVFEPGAPNFPTVRSPPMTRSRVRAATEAALRATKEAERLAQSNLSAEAVIGAAQEAGRLAQAVLEAVQEEEDARQAESRRSPFSSSSPWTVLSSPLAAENSPINLRGSARAHEYGSLLAPIDIPPDHRAPSTQTMGGIRDEDEPMSYAGASTQSLLFNPSTLVIIDEDEPMPLAGASTHPLFYPSIPSTGGDVNEGGSTLSAALSSTSSTMAAPHVILGSPFDAIPRLALPKDPPAPKGSGKKRTRN